MYDKQTYKGTASNQYGFINDEDTLEYVNTATGADFGDTTKWTGPNGESYPIGTVTIPAGQTSATVTIPINDDGQKETSEYFLTAFFADSLSDGTYVSKASRHPQVEIENSTTFQDVLNIDLDTLWRMSWDSRTWTIRGDDHDTVRLVGYESNWTQSDGTQYEYFEPFRFEGQQTVDGVLYNVYDLWDARVLIEDGVTVIYKKRDLGKVKEGENSQPDFWYKWGTVKENETSVYGAVRDSYDQDGDTITYSIDENYRDGWLFDIDSATGELTWKVAPDYEAPNSFNVPSGMTDFSNTDDNQMRHYNSYQVKVIGNDGSGEDNATVSRDLWIDVKNVPDYEGYDPTNKIPFFRDMWGEETQFIDDATNQSVKIKGVWAIINEKDAWNQKHHHSNSDISAAYYVSAHENCGDIVFYDPRPARVYKFPIINSPNKLNATINSVKPESGLLVLFPSYLEHSVNPNLSNKKRIVISFNLSLEKK